MKTKLKTFLLCFSLVLPALLHGQETAPDSDRECDTKLRNKLTQMTREEQSITSQINILRTQLSSSRQSTSKLNQKVQDINTNGQSQSVEQVKQDQQAQLSLAQDQARVTSLETAIELKSKVINELEAGLSDTQNPEETQSRISNLKQDLATLEVQLVEAKATYLSSRTNAENAQGQSQGETFIDPSAGAKGQIGVQQFNQTMIQSKIDALVKEKSYLMSRIALYKKFFEPANDFENFDEAQEEETNAADQAMLDLMALAAAGVALSCTPHVDAESGIPESYTLFKSASADFLARSRTNNQSYQDKNRGLLCNDLNPEVEVNEQYKAMKKQLLRHIVVRETVEEKLDIITGSVGMYAPAYAAALKEVTEKKSLIKKRKKELKEEKKNLREKKSEEEQAKMLLTAAAAVAALWKDKDAATPPGAPTKPGVSSTTIKKVALAAAAAIYYFKKKKEREEAEEKVEIAKENLKVAKVHWHLDCGGQTAGNQGGGQGGGNNQSYIESFPFPWSPSLERERIYNRFTQIKQEGPSESSVLNMILSVLSPKAFAQTNIGEAKSVGLQSGTGAAQYFVQAKREHLKTQKTAFQLPSARASYLGGVMSVGEEALAVAHDVLTKTKKYENELKKNLYQMAQSMKKDIQGNAANSYTISRQANCYQATGGSVNVDGTCACKESNTCGFTSSLANLSGPLAASGHLALQAANNTLAGNASAAANLRAQLQKNAKALNDYTSKLKNKINSQRKEDGQSRLHFEEDGRRNKLSLRSRSLDAFKKSSPKLAASSGFNTKEKKKGKEVKKVSYSPTDYNVTGIDSGLTKSKNDNPYNVFANLKPKNVAHPKSLSFRGPSNNDKFKNPHEGINGDIGPSLWKIISKRYSRSAYPRLFE